MSVAVVLGVAILLLVLWMCIRNVRETEESFMQQSSMDSSKIDNIDSFLLCVFAVSVIFDIFLRRIVWHLMTINYFFYNKVQSLPQPIFSKYLLIICSFENVICEFKYTYMYMECNKFTNYTPYTFVDDILKLSIFECYKYTNNKPAITWLKYCKSHGFNKNGINLI